MTHVLLGHRYCLLATYKRDRSPVPSPVWFGLDSDHLYVWTEVNAYKAKRLARDKRALLAPCDPTGRPLGDPIAATGRVLTTEAERLSRPIAEAHYLEFVPA